MSDSEIGKPRQRERQAGARPHDPRARVDGDVRQLLENADEIARHALGEARAAEPEEVGEAAGGRVVRVARAEVGVGRSARA